MICFAWSGFPQYAARCVGAFVRSSSEPVSVVATRPRVPIQGMEDLCGCPVHWLERATPSAAPSLPPSFTFASISTLIVSGWGIPAFNQLAAEVRKSGGRVICMVDNNFAFSLKEVVKAIRFRLKLRNRYDGFFVPGKSGRRLLRFYGVADEKIAEGLYSADASLFHDGQPLADREKKIVYVGQLCARKNVLRMCRAFVQAEARVKGGWSLELYGSGPLRDEIGKIAVAHACIRVHDFLQPEDLAEKYRAARAFCLASVEEHWGLVVHEAALSGCFLLASTAVGAAADFAAPENAALFDAADSAAISAAFERVMTMDDAALRKAHDKSLTLAARASLDQFCQGVRALGAC